MNTKSVLTDAEIDACRIAGGGIAEDFARAIERAVLQSPELQQRMEAYATAKVSEALEDAAQTCEARIGQHSVGMKPEDVEDCDEEARMCAESIRALIPSKGQS